MAILTWELVFLDLVDRSGRSTPLARARGRASLFHLGDIVGAPAKPARAAECAPFSRRPRAQLLRTHPSPLPDTFPRADPTSIMRYRRRYPHLTDDEETRSTSLPVYALIVAIRNLPRGTVSRSLDPALQPDRLRSFARRSATHSNSLDQETSNLRIAGGEPTSSRLIVAASRRSTRSDASFRTRGFSYKHNPEFTNAQW